MPLRFVFFFVFFFACRGKKSNKYKWINRMDWFHLFIFLNVGKVSSFQMGIKGLSFLKLRGRRMFLTLITTLCASFLFWAPEKTPLLTNFLPPKEHLELIPRAIDPLDDENPQVVKELFKMPKLESGSREMDGISRDGMAEFPTPEGSKKIESNEEKSPTIMKKVIDPVDGEENHQVEEGLFEKPKLESMGKETDGIGGDRIAESTRPEESENLENKEMKSPITTKKSIHPSDGENPELDKELSDMPTLESRSKEMGGISGDGMTESAAPKGSTSTESKEVKPPIIITKEECNYAKGEWVPDDRRPLYSGANCKQWLSEMWACRLTKRSDFSFEAFRWKPDHCNMPEFEGSAFLEKMRGKTLAFVGDSLGRQQFQSLMCMVTSGKHDKDVKDVGEEYGLLGAQGSKRPTGWAYRFSRTNTTILYHWSATLCELEPLNSSDPLTSIAMHIDRPAMFLQEYLHKIDVVVLNTGHHWNRGKLNGNRWTMYADGSPVVDRHLRMMGNAKNHTIHSVVRWLDKQLSSHLHLRVFFRSLSPRHFVNGEWNTGGSCANTSPLTHGNRVSKDESSDPVIARAVKGTNVRFLDVTAFSQLRDEAHISKYRIKASTGVHDCLHWCLPGIPDAWNEVLFAQL